MAPEVSAAAAAALEVCRCHMSQICISNRLPQPLTSHLKTR